MKYICEQCRESFEYDEVKIYDEDTCICFECLDEQQTKIDLCNQIDQGTL